MTIPALSIALSAFNCESTIEYALRSITFQSFDDWELILLDDGSQDKTYEICRSFSDSRIRIIRDGRNLGLAARLNQAIDLARGEFLGRMDADDVSFPERFAQQVNFLRSHRDIDLVGAQMLVIDTSFMPIGIQACPLEHENIVRRPWKIIPMWHPTWCGRLSWYRRYRYDPGVGRIEDQELLLRALADSRFANLPDCVLAYTCVDLNAPKSFRSRRSYSRNLWKEALRRRDARYAIYGMGYLAASVPYLYRALGGLQNRSKSLAKVTQELDHHWRDIGGRLGLPLNMIDKGQ